MKVKVISLPYIFQVLYVLCFSRPRYQVSVYRTIDPLVSRTDWNFLIQEQTEILLNEQNFKHRLEYLFQEKSERFDFKNDWKQIGSFILN